MGTTSGSGKRFWIGFLVGVAGTLGLVAAVATVFVLNAKRDVERCLDARAEEATARARPVLAPAPLDRDQLRAQGAMDYGWSLEDAKGRVVQASDFRDQVLVLVRWASWCAPCVAETPSLERLADALHSEPVRVLLYTTEDRAPVRQFLKKSPSKLPIFFVREGVPASIWTAELPSAAVVNCSGQVVFRHTGGANWDTPEAVATLRGLAAEC